MRDLGLLCLGRIVHVNFQQKPVELRLRKWIGSFLLNRIACREHVKWIRKVVRLTAGGDLPFLHCLQQRSLGFWRRTIDLVGEHEVPKNGPWKELYLATQPPRCQLDT